MRLSDDADWYCDRCGLHRDEHRLGAAAYQCVFDPVLRDDSLQMALDGRLARVGALADEWTSATCQTDGAPCSWHRVSAECADELRAALTARPASEETAL